jgi:hypothetical protein
MTGLLSRFMRSVTVGSTDMGSRHFRYDCSCGARIIECECPGYKFVEIVLCKDVHHDHKRSKHCRPGCPRWGHVDERKAVKK